MRARLGLILNMSHVSLILKALSRACGLAIPTQTNVTKTPKSKLSNSKI